MFARLVFTRHFPTASLEGMVRAQGEGCCGLLTALHCSGVQGGARVRRGRRRVAHAARALRERVRGAPRVQLAAPRTGARPKLAG
jgi:hypothetical protein